MLNQCSFIGRLGKEPETRHTQSGDAVTSFSVACDEKWKDKDGNQQSKTEWINCVAWRKLGEICGQYLTKGSLVYVSGKMQTRQWDDKDGNKRYITEIVAREMKMLSPKSGSGPAAENGQSQAGEYSPMPDGGEDVPFN